MRMQETKSGLVVPVSVDKPEPKKDFLPLELKEESSRKEASECFRKLRNMMGVRGNFVVPNMVAKGRELAIMALAKQLLGEDWSCEILC